MFAQTNQSHDPLYAGFLFYVKLVTADLVWIGYSMVHTNEIEGKEMVVHKHAEMIKAKADNMDLVVFLNIGPEWVESKLDTMVANQDMDFFLCLPKHNDNGQCLHWLNGGEVEFSRDGENWQNECEKYHGWVNYCGMMNHDVEFRIKPRKEKRWIVAHPRALASMMYFESEERAKSTV